MNDAMFAMIALGLWEILLILLVLLVMAGLAVGVILLVAWLVRRGKTQPPAIPPIQPQPDQPKPRSSTCSHCGTPLPPDSPQGLCPRCVMGVGLATQTEATGEFGPHGTKVIQPPPSPADIAKSFPQLEILECLGRGGMGVVYKARQPKLNRLVALKILAPEKGADPKFAERFLREAQALARLSHPNIVTVHDFGEADGMFFLLMEYVDGMTLRQLLREGLMKPEQALAIVPPICEALQFAHEQGVVHRDIKPENVLLDKQGRVKIADFGIAKIVGDDGRAGSPLPARAAQAEGGAHGVTCPTVSLTQDQVLGTPHYMAPEQVEHPQTVDHRADIYSLGVVFYEMLTGELPLGKFQPPSKKVQVDVRLDEVVLHALEKEPERRYQQASEVKTDVETIAATPSPGRSGRESAPVEDRSAAAVARSNSKEATIVFAGTVFFLFLLAVVAELSRAIELPFRAFLTVLSVVGLVICALSLAGLWPFPSPWFPEPNFSSRNLRRRKAMPASEAELRPRFSRTAIWGAIWAPFGLVALGILLLRFPVPAGSPAPMRLLFLTLPLGLLGLAAPFGTTILGGIAISQIRHSRGRLYGLGLAVFDALLFPLLALDALIAAFFWVVLPNFIPTSVDRTLAVWLMGALALVTAAVVDCLIIRSVWRAVNKPLGRGQSPSTPAAASAASAPRSGGGWRIVAVIAAAVLLILAVPVGSLVLAIYLPYHSRQQVARAEAVVRVEEKLRQEIEQRLREAGWRVDGFSVSVTPDLKRAECRFGTAWKNGLSESPFNAAIRITPQGKNLWSVTGDRQFEFLHFSVDTSAEMKPTLVPGSVTWAPVVDVDPNAHPRAGVSLLANFGSVREVTLNDIDDLRGAEALDLDSGRLLDLPKDLETRPKPEGLQWLKDQSADLLLDHVGGRWGLMTIADNELKLVPLLNNSWEASSESSLSNALAAPPGGVKADPQRVWRIYADDKWEMVREKDLPFPLPPALEVKERGAWRVYVLATNTQPPLTFAFQTGSGARGLLQITGFTAQPNSARLRYKLVRPNGPRSIAQTAEVGSAAISPFIGEVVELTVTDLADLDNGTLLSLPLPGVLSDRDPARYNWFNSNTNAFPFMRRGGIDLFQGNRGLIGVDLLVVPLESKDWRGLTRPGLRSKLAALQLPKAPATSIISNERRPFGFQTREGALGILEISDRNAARGVRIRYKLLPSSGNASPLAALSEPDRLRAVALFNDIEDFGHEFEAAFASTNLAAAQTGTRRLLNLLTNFNAVARGTDCEFPAALFDDIAKVRQALDEGDWNQARLLARHNEEYAQRFRSIAATMAALAREQQSRPTETRQPRPRGKSSDASK